MHRLGETRSRRTGDHLLQTPDTFVWAPLPGMHHATACVHAAPALGAAFTQYTALFEEDGELGATPLQRFVYVLEGSVQVAAERLQPGGYAYLPPGSSQPVKAVGGSARAMVIDKPFVRGATLPPTFVSGAERDVPPVSLMGDEALQVRALMPADDAFDFAVNTMEYQPGARLGMVEVHVMEHGLLMLEGEGIYRLGESWYPVAAGDFIWMGPFCPQWFGALGKVPARYLIYKNWNRHPQDEAAR